MHDLSGSVLGKAETRKENELEQRMLMNLNKKSWVDGLTLNDYNGHCTINKVNKWVFVKLGAMPNLVTPIMDYLFNFGNHIPL